MDNIDYLKKVRISNRLSQEDMSTILKMSRITYIHSENGKRELKKNEIEILSENFEIDISLFFSKTEKDEDNEGITAIENVVLYILSKCAGKPNLGKIVLNKLLYFIDFNYHEKYHTSLTGTTYIKMPMGPVPEHMETLLDTMEKDGLIEICQGIYFGYIQTRLMPKVSPQLKEFDLQALAEIDYVINQYGDKTGKWLTEFSHGDIPWKVTKTIGQEISYGLAHYREGIYRVTEEEDDG